MTQTIPATHPLAVTVNFEAMMEASIHIKRSGTLRVPATPLRDLQACAVFFHPGSAHVEQGFYMVSDPRSEDAHECITWDIEEWAGLSVRYDADQHFLICHVFDKSDASETAYLSFDLADLEVTTRAITSIPGDDRVVVIGEDVDFEAGPERARALVTALAEVFVANQKGGAQ
jgi:hypothetical protein